MISPPPRDGPRVRGDKPYSAIAHLADNVVPFVAMANGLRQYSFSAPAVYEADLEQGFLIIEDLGEERLGAGDPPAATPRPDETPVGGLPSLPGRPPPHT